MKFLFTKSGNTHSKLKLNKGKSMSEQIMAWFNQFNCPSDDEHCPV